MDQPNTSKPAPAMPPEPEYLDLRALARYASLSRRTVQTFLSDPAHPLPFYTPSGKKKLVRRREFDEWMQTYRRTGTDTAEEINRVVAEVMNAQRAPRRIGRPDARE